MMDRLNPIIYKVLGVVICFVLLSGSIYYLTDLKVFLVLLVFFFLVATLLAGFGYGVTAIKEIRKYSSAPRRSKRMKKDLWGELLFSGTLSLAFFGFAALVVVTLFSTSAASVNGDANPEQNVGDNAIYAPGVER